MKVIEYGSDHPQVILLLHGGGLSWWNYQQAAMLLADRFHVVLPVLDGHSGSDAPFTTIEVNAARIAAYIDEHFGGHILLAGGLSLGGQVLLELLAQRSSICDYAIIESALTLPMPLTKALTAPSFSLCYPLIRQRWFAKLQFRQLGIQPGLFEPYFTDSAAIAQSDMIAFLQANADYRIKESLSDCTAKALVLVGGKERPIMKRSAGMIAQALPGAVLEECRGLGHGALSLNHPQQYAEKLLHLLAQPV